MDPFFRNSISKSGHKNTHNSFKIFEQAVRDTDIRHTTQMFLADCTDNGHEYRMPIWQLYTLMYMIKGKFAETVQGDISPLWFNVARDVVRHFMKMKELREKALVSSFVTQNVCG